ncbi:hypothetical protein WH47_02412 [Habropoda laboriosa]|uniref:Uncharacterized protein n=1 Tax=Habropoda laboriosa TaxID=597456 RepID=A0A0L7RKB5_9HYME|nr:hypothetical protein WH47_02412 [Habropoda laboriosa]
MSAIYAKFEAIFLCCHPKGPKMTFADADKYMHNSKEFVKEWVKLYKEAKCVDDFLSQGSKRAAATREDKVILQHFSKNLTLSLRKRQSHLRNKSINVNIMTIKRRLHDFAWYSTVAFNHCPYGQRIRLPRAYTNRRATRDAFSSNDAYTYVQPLAKSFRPNAMVRC